MQSFLELHGSSHNGTDCVNTADWTPSEYFTNLVLSGVYAYGDLSGKACVVGTDLTAGNGDTVNVRYVTARTGSCASTSCGGCLSAVSTTFGNYPITVHQHGDYDKIVAFADWQAKGDIISQVANEMSKRLAHCRDLWIWNSLLDGTYSAGTVTSSSSWSASRSLPTDCCMYTFDIYNTIITARQQLMAAGYEPDYVLLHPYVASYLYYKDAGFIPFAQNIMPLVEYGSDGYVKSIAGLKVIEVKVAAGRTAAPTTSAASHSLGFVIDSRRAIGEAYGMTPKFHEFYDGICNATELTVWMYWGNALLDEDAIRPLRNP
jgi:hypothetical protein